MSSGGCILVNEYKCANTPYAKSRNHGAFGAKENPVVCAFQTKMGDAATTNIAPESSIFLIPMCRQRNTMSVPNKMSVKMTVNACKLNMMPRMRNAKRYRFCK